MYEQGSPQWLIWRKTRIGASDAPVIMGVSPWKTPLQLWEEKLGLTENNFDSPAMRRGRELEEPARQAFERETGLIVFPQVLESPVFPFMVASFDGLTMDGSAGVEIKCPGNKDHQTALDGKIPSKYYAQLQHQMCVAASLKEIYYYSYDGVDGVLLECPCNEEYCSQLIYKEQQFYDLMQSKVPPEMTDRDYTVRDDLRYLKCEERWVKSKEELKNAALVEETARNELIGMSPSNTRGKFTKVTKYFQKGRIDYGKIPELESIELEQHRGKPTERYRISCL